MMQEHRLAAIMFTDIAGYTTLMGKDEGKAFVMLKINREIHDTLIKRFKGRLIKEMGDEILASFASASNAVRCAIEIQQEANSENIKLRIGIHEGEMVFEGADVLGDGVNIASRLQESAVPGDIIISEALFNNIRNKAGFAVEFLGEKSLKNVGKAIKVYKVGAEAKTMTDKEEIKKQMQEKKGLQKPILWISGFSLFIIALSLLWFFYLKPAKVREEPSKPKSIAVLPFVDMSPQKDQEYFCDGITEELINRLSNIKELKVPARTSVFMFKGKTPGMREIGDKLKVQTVLEGSVQKSGNRLRITAQLINIEDGYHLWS